MASQADVAKLADLSSRGRISLNQAEAYLAEKGWKKNERDEALKYVDTITRERHSKKQSTSKSGTGIYILIFIILGMVVLYYFYSNIITLPKF